MKKRLLRDILARKDPEGYYVIPAKREALEHLESLLKDLSIVEAGDIVLLRTRSRRVAERIAVILHKTGFLA